MREREGLKRERDTDKSLKRVPREIRKKSLNRGRSESEAPERQRQKCWFVRNKARGKGDKNLVFLLLLLVVVVVFLVPLCFGF